MFSSKRGIALIGFIVAFSHLAMAQNATRRDPQPLIRYPLGIDSQKQEGVPQGRLIGPRMFQSKIIENTVRRYWISVPAQYDAAQPAAVLVFQDGARAINPDGVLRVPQVLDNLIAKRSIPVTIGIYITPGQRGTDFPDSIGTGNPDNRDREYDVLNDAYARMVIDEILPEVGKEFKLSSLASDRAIGGSSSGGICAFTVAWERPQEFRNVISLIGSFTNIHGGHVYPSLVQKNPMKPIRVFLQDGVNDLRNANDLDRDWHIQNQKMVAALQEKGYEMAHVFGSGGHSDDHGGAILPQMLQWIWRDHPQVRKSNLDLIESAKAIQPETVDLFPGFDSQAKTDPTGTYTWENRGRGIASTSTLKIAVNQGKISGTLETQRSDEAPTSEALADPTLVGNKLIFGAISRFRDQENMVTYQGIVSSEGIQGWRLMDFGGQARDTNWNAKRQK